jgi:hypothetical protein
MSDKTKAIKVRTIFTLITILLLQTLALSACGATNQAETPTPTDTSPAVLIPNVGGMIESGNTAGANTEVSNIKIAARAYSLDKQEVLSFTSDVLTPLYVTLQPRAKYYINAVKGVITRVDSVSGGWPAIVFRLSDQKWIKGMPDNNHTNDQDIP